MASKKISPIPKSYAGNFNTMESSLAKAGYFRSPGTYRGITPYKENGKYRTGLDVNSAHFLRLIQNMSDEDKKSEIERIEKTKERLEKATGLDLSPTSNYYNYAIHGEDVPEDRKTTMVKLGTQDVFFDMTDPYKEITWHWVKVHPIIAPSFEAYKRGEVHPDTVQYYVCDDDVETRMVYNRKKEINTAVGVYTSLSLTKQKQVARLMGLPVSDDTKEETVYNLVDNLLKEGEFKSGEHSGLSTVKIFNEIVSQSDDSLKVKDLVAQSIRFNIYRLGSGGRVYEGTEKRFSNRNEMIEFFLDDKNQDDLLALETKVKVKKTM